MRAWHTLKGTLVIIIIKKLKNRYFTDSRFGLDRGIQLHNTGHVGPAAVLVA